MIYTTYGLKNSYISAFIGENSYSQLDRWEWCEQHKNICFNSGAFFFTFLWFYHKKMYRESAAIMTASLAAAVIGSLMTYAVDDFCLLYILAFVPINIFCGLFGEYMYFRSTRMNILCQMADMSTDRDDSRVRILSKFGKEVRETSSPILPAEIIAACFIVITILSSIYSIMAYNYAVTYLHINQIGCFLVIRQ